MLCLWKKDFAMVSFPYREPRASFVEIHSRSGAPPMRISLCTDESALCTDRSIRIGALARSFIAMAS